MCINAGMPGDPIQHEQPLLWCLNTSECCLTMQGTSPPRAHKFAHGTLPYPKPHVQRSDGVLMGLAA